MKIKNTLALSLSITLLGISVFLPTISRAVVAPVENDEEVIERLPAEARERAQERIQERVEDQQEARVQIQEKAQEGLEGARTQVGQAHAKRLQRRFSFYERRLDAIATKIQARLAMLQEQGVNVSVAQETLDEALQKIEVGMMQAQEATQQLEQFDLEQDPSEIAMQARTQAQQAREDFQEAVQLMKEAVRSALVAQQ